MTKKPARESPKNYRTITDSLRRFNLINKGNSKLISKLKFEGLVSLYVITIFAIIFLIFDLFGNIQRQREINFQKEKIQSEIKLWEDIASKFKDYKEAYYKLAVLEYQLGNIDKAKIYLNKSLYIDPNFEKARELKKILDSY